MALVPTIIKAGTHAAIPAAATTNDGYLYFETDTKKLFRSNASAWVQVAGDANLDSAAIDATGTLKLSGDISPAQITSNQNDYNPTGLSTASVLRLNTDASRNITSLQGGADGRIVVIVNVGSQALVIKDDDGSTGTAVNRFALSGDITINGDEAAIFIYDSTSSRWRCIGKSIAAGGGGTTATDFTKGTAALTTTEAFIEWHTTRKVLLLYDTQRERALSPIGWTPYAYQTGFEPSQTFTGTALVANGGSVAVPIELTAPMLLQSVSLWNTDTASARTWGWDLYEQYLNNGNAGENTLTRVAASTADETFTAAAASIRTINAASVPVYLPPGLYWLVLQCRHATNTFSIGAYNVTGFTPNTLQTKTTTNPNGATLDFIAATWAKGTGFRAARLNGRVFGDTAAF
jgi:hypothetical protein